MTDEQKIELTNKIQTLSTECYRLGLGVGSKSEVFVEGELFSPITLRERQLQADKDLVEFIKGL